MADVTLVEDALGKSMVFVTGLPKAMERAKVRGGAG